MEKQQLLYGVKYGDKVHFDFAVRLPVVRDTIEALRLTDEACGTTEGASAGMYYRVALMAQAIEELGSLNKEDITPELLLDELNDDDLISLMLRLTLLKKADGFEQKLTGYRTLVLALGRYGISEQQIGSMTRTELDGYTEALARLHGKKTGQTTTRTTRTVKSQRRKKVGKRR
jgi:hypothetical protein